MADDGDLREAALPLSREERMAKLTPEEMEARLRLPAVTKVVRSYKWLDGSAGNERRDCSECHRERCAEYECLIVHPDSDMLPVPMIATYTHCAPCMNELCMTLAFSDENSKSDAKSGKWLHGTVSHRSLCAQCGVRLWKGDGFFECVLPNTKEEPARWCYDCCERRLFTHDTPKVKAVGKE